MGWGAVTSACRKDTNDYINRNLIALPSKVIVKDGANNVVAATEYRYDEYPLTTYSTVTNWTAPPNPSAARGNVTTVRRWQNFNYTTGTQQAWGGWTSGTWVETHSWYDQCGNVVKVRDANNNDTVSSYTDNFYGAAPQNTYAYLTSVTTPGPALTTTIKYDFNTGLVKEVTDPNNVKTRTDYNDPFNRPTKTIRAEGTSVQNQTVIQYEDASRRVITTSDKDTFGESNAGNGLRSVVFYDGYGRATRNTSYEGSNNWSVSDTTYDTFGRVSQVSNPYRITAASVSAIPAAADAVSKVWTTTTYDALSRVKTVQTPDTSVATTDYSGAAVTVTDQAGKQRRSLADALGRLIRVDEPNGCNNCLGSVSSPTQPTSYAYDVLGNLRKVTQGTQARWFAYDSLSRLIYAKNPEQNANSAFVYTDNTIAPGNSQWSMAYSYDLNGNLLTRVDARNVTTTYGYDNLNRNTAVSYNDGVTPGVNRYYDGAISNGKGRLHYSISYNSHPVSSYAYSITQINGYDSMGRVTGQQQGFLNSAGTQWYYYPVSRTYNLASGVSSQTYPSNRTVSYNYDNAGRLSSFSGNLGDGVSRTYADTFSYTAGGQMLKERFGTTNTAVGGGTGLYHNLHYNSRLQAVDNRLGHDPNDEWNWSRGALITYYSNQARSIGNPFMNASDNNGNVTMAEHYVPTDEAITTYSITLRDTYEYDELSRLKQSNGLQRNTAGSWFSIYAQWYNYDQWGNRTIDNGATWGNAINNLAYTVSSTNNRINGVTYDAAGNVTSDPNGVSTATYDGENRMKSALKGGTQSYYVYDADGKRARRIISGVEMWQVYGIEGELVAEYPVNGSAGAPQKEYGYRSGRMLIVGEGSKVQWMLPDHLGTPRMVVDKSGRLDDDPSTPSYDERLVRHDYLPFGEELLVGMGNSSIRSAVMGYVTDAVRQKFGSKERDTETGLDYFLARYYVNIQGRFTSPDEFTGGPTELFAIVAAHNPSFYADIAEPQSLSKYSYCLNNPLKFVDPDGHQGVLADYISRQVATGVGKSVANVFIGMDNEGNKVLRALGWDRQDTEYYRPSNELQAVVMGTTNKELALAGLLGGRTPVNVMVAEGEGAAVLAVTPRMRSAINTAMGELGEIALAKMVGGQSQVSIPTSIGRSRILDQVVTGTGGIVGHEAKVGYVKSLSGEIRTQIAKDAELMATGQVKQVVWHFFRNPTTGKIGANQKVLDALNKNGIQYEIHNGIDITK